MSLVFFLKLFRSKNGTHDAVGEVDVRGICFSFSDSKSIASGRQLTTSQLSMPA